MSPFKAVLGIRYIVPDFWIGRGRVVAKTWSSLIRGRLNLPAEVRLTGDWAEGSVSIECSHAHKPNPSSVLCKERDFQRFLIKELNDHMEDK